MQDETPPISFGSLGLDARLLTALDNLGFEAPTPIQARAIPILLEGKDIIGRARTGSGKTAAFGLALLQRIAETEGHGIRGLVLAPTRELALQVSDALDSFAKKLPHSIATVYGGAPYPPQIRALKTASIVVGTPGRMLDHLEKGTLKLGNLEVFVLDEADEMLRMGFIDDVETLLSAAPSERQVVLFSATMPPAIAKVARRHQKNAIEVQVEERALMSDHIKQVFMRVPRRHRLEALVRVLRGTDREATLVFARTRRDCAEVADELARRGVPADALHGDLNQSARERVVTRLRARRLDVVVATDVAARGLDVDHITHVINLELPSDAETYVHRIGRTGRVGRAGTAILFTTPKEMRKLKYLEQELGSQIDEIDVPSDAELAAHQKDTVRRLLADKIDEPGMELAEEWVTDLAKALDVPVEKIAAAAILKMAEKLGFDMNAKPSDQPPSWSKRPSARTAQSRENCNEVELFFPVGRRDGVGPSDFVGALANEAGIDGQRIGRVHIFENKAFVGLPKEVADDVLARIPEIEIRGNMVPMTLALTRAEDEEGGSRAGRGRGRGRGGYRGRGRGRGRGDFRGRGRGRGGYRGRGDFRGRGDSRGRGGFRGRGRGGFRGGRGNND